MKAFGTDYDGVIINIEPQKSIVFGKILNRHWKIDIEEAANFWMSNGGTSRRYKFDYFYNKKFHSQLSDKNYTLIQEEYSQILKTKYYPSVKLLPGARELLEYAKNNYGFLFVSSGMTMEEIKYLADLNGTSSYFDLILGTNELYKSKRDHYRKIIKEENPESIVFIADSVEDMRITKEFLNTTAIGVLTNSSKKELIEAGANLAAKDLHEVLNLLKNNT